MARLDMRLVGRAAPGFAGYALTEDALRLALERLTRGKVDWDDMRRAITCPQVVRPDGLRGCAYQQHGTVSVVVDHAQRLIVAVGAVVTDSEA